MRRLSGALFLAIAGILASGAATAEPAEQITVMAPQQAIVPESTTVLDSQAIARSGDHSLGALLDQIPAFGSQGINNAQTEGGFGEYFIDLRNLNFNRIPIMPRQWGRLSPGTTLHLDWQTNWLLDYRLHTLGQAGFTQYAGTFPGLNEVGSYARVRGRASAALARGQWSLGWTGRYISGARVLGDDAGDLYGRAPGILYQDVDVSGRLGGAGDGNGRYR